MADNQTATAWLTREQIDSVLDNLTGQDILAGVTDEGGTGAMTAGRAFDAAAHRLGLSNGTAAMLQVHPRDAVHLAQRIGKLLAVDSPKAKRPASSPDSASTGA